MPPKSKKKSEMDIMLEELKAAEMRREGKRKIHG